MNTELPGSINSIIHSRKSIYPYQYEAGANVDDAIIRQILENANCAPNHKKTEPWRFTVFTGKGLKRFSDLQVSLVKKHQPDTGELKLKKLAEYPLMASHIIAIGMKRHESRVPEIEELLAMGCVIENMFLTTTAYNLGSYFSTGGVTYIEEAKQYFGLDAGDRLIGFFYVGVRKELPDIFKSRGPVGEKTTWVNE